MENAGGAVTILAVCLIVLAIGAMGRKVEWLVNFVLRAVMGTVGIYAINYMLAARQFHVAVGINPFTVLTWNPWISWGCGTLRHSFFQNFVNSLQ